MTEKVKTRRADDAMLAIARALNASLTMETAITHVLEVIGETIAADAVSVFVRDTEIAETEDLQVSFARRGGGVERGAASIALGLSGLVLHTGEPVLVDDVQEDSRFEGKLDSQFGTRTRALIAVPMRRRERLNGLIEAIRERPRPFDRDDLEFLSAVSDELAVAVENGLLVARLTDEARDRALLLDAARAVSRSLDLGEVVTTLLTALERVVPYDAVGVYLFDSKTGEVSGLEHRGYLPGATELLNRRPGEGITAWVAQHGSSVNVGNVEDDPRYIEARPTSQSEVAVPIVRSGAVIGVITLESDELNAFSDRQVVLLEIFAEHVASAITNARLHARERERARLDYEIELAQQIQNAALPASNLAGSNWEAAGVNVASNFVGGDYFDYFCRRDGQVGVALVDVSGHGIAAALLMQAVRSAIRLTVNSSRSPAIIMRRIARVLYESTPMNQYAAMVIGRLDPANGTLLYSNGGHIPPLRIGEDGAEPLPSTGFIAGAMADSQYTDATVQLEPGDLLLFYTDGLTELNNSEGEEFGVEYLTEIVTSLRHLPLDDIIKGVRQRARAFRSKEAPTDDVTLMLVRWTGA